MTVRPPLSIEELAPKIAAREISSVEITKACLDVIAERDGALRAFITVLADEALAAAARADADCAAGRYRGPLHGVPVSLKDLIDVAGVPTTAASRVRAEPAGPTQQRHDRRATPSSSGATCEFAFGTT
jgi:aspartyl-tRNA(Asn)/glutamyl-tRNA(Gln) amidotransferase subunit A